MDDVYAPVLMLGVMSRAYARANIDTMDRARADQLQLQFERDCALAAREQGRARKPKWRDAILMVTPHECKPYRWDAVIYNRATFRDFRIWKTGDTVDTAVPVD